MKATHYPADNHSRYFAAATALRSRSTDRSRQVGCVIVGPDGAIRAEGWNALPDGYDHDDDCFHQRPAKYRYTVHAEERAICHAARDGIPLKGCSAYVPWFPCMGCARKLSEAGISKVYAYEPDFSDPTFGEEFRDVFGHFARTGIELILFIPPEPLQTQR